LLLQIVIHIHGD